MKRLLLCCSFSILALCRPFSSQADILVDNSPPDHLNGYGSSNGFPAYVANSFSLAASSVITGFNFWGIYFPSGGPTSPFVVNFFANAGTQPGALISSFSATLTGAATGGITITYPEYKFQTNFAPFSLTAGSYWVSVYDSSSSKAFYWLNSSETGTIADSSGTMSPTTGPWGTAPGTMAFQIAGTSAVPEGQSSTRMLLCLGFVSLALPKALHRKKDRKTTAESC